MTPQSFEDFKDLSPGPRRQSIVRKYVKIHRRIQVRVAARTGMSQAMVSKVMNGFRTCSAEMLQAIAAEERVSLRKAA